MGDVAESRRWRGRPWLSRTIRLAAHAIPFVLVTFVIWQIHRWLGPAGSLAEAVARWLLLSVASTFALVGLDRVARRVLPLATLFKLSLIFPDEAPSRFSVALRQNTTRSLQRDLEAGTLDADTPQEAAELLLTLVAELSRHDRLTRGHAERTRAYADMVAAELDLSDIERSKLQWAALLHDVGKLKVPSAILNKSGKPTAREWKVLQTHPDEGWALIAPLRPWLGEWARAVRDHHERWDGDGYPRGLAGAQISRAGRIVAVVDAFDVMTSTRSYKEPMSVAAARAELADCAGSQFDADIVRAFLAVGIGRLRLVMGPLSWLAQLPAITRIPVGQLPAAAVSTTAAATVAIASVVTPAPEPDPVEAAAREVATTTTIVIPASTTLVPSTSETLRITTTSAAPSTTSTTIEPTSTTASTTTTVGTTTTAAPTTSTTTSTTTTTTSTTTTTTIASPDYFAEAYLGSNGESTAVSVLPLGGQPSQTSLPNYDTDYNDDPGRTIKRDDGLELTNIEEVQLWAIEIGQDFRAFGTPTLEVWVAAEDFDLDSTSKITATFARCRVNPAIECDWLSQTTATFSQADFGSDFGRLVVVMPDVDDIIPAGEWAVIAINVPNSSDDDVWLAFDTKMHQSRGYLE